MDKSSLNRNLVYAFILVLNVLTALLLLRVSSWIVILVMAVVLALVFIYVSAHLRRQYKLISKVAGYIAQGDYGQRIPELQVNEFDLLGQNLNKMLGKLDTTISHLAIHREELRLVLASIDDVLWSQNPEGKLEWANQAFVKLFPAYDENRWQYHYEVIREPILTEQIKAAANGEEKLLREIQIGEHYFLLSASRNEAARRTVFILQNIDPIRQAEQMKKDFIVNLAHEFRTPLTAIKGFSEAMQDSSAEDKTRYLKIIRNHTERLIHLIGDLEKLIRLERISRLETHEIELKSFFEDIRLILSPDIEAKGLELKIELDERISRLDCDPFQMEQVFLNLVQNSLRFTDSGYIMIRTSALDHELLIEVSDSGRGIAEHHLGRIFERFYVAEASRNRNLSGSGLGLAIVKHIVQLHRGRIEVESEPERGTTFKIWLPTAQAASAW